MLELLEPLEGLLVAAVAVGVPAEPPERRHAVAASGRGAGEGAVEPARALDLPLPFPEQRREQRGALALQSAHLPGDLLELLPGAPRVAGARERARVGDAVLGVGLELGEGSRRLRVATQAEERVGPLPTGPLRVGSVERAEAERALVGLERRLVAALAEEHVAAAPVGLRGAQRPAQLPLQDDELLLRLLRLRRQGLARPDLQEPLGRRLGLPGAQVGASDLELQLGAPLGALRECQPALPGGPRLGLLALLGVRAAQLMVDVGARRGIGVGPGLSERDGLLVATRQDVEAQPVEVGVVRHHRVAFGEGGEQPLRPLRLAGVDRLHGVAQRGAGPLEQRRIDPVERDAFGGGPRRGRERSPRRSATSARPSSPRAAPGLRGRSQTRSVEPVPITDRVCRIPMSAAL